MIFKRNKNKEGKPVLISAVPKRWETKRLILKPYTKEDFNPWIDIREKSRTHLQPWEPTWASDILSKESFDKRVLFNTHQWEKDLGYCMLAHRKEDHQIVAGVNLTQIRKTASMSSGILGYWCGANYLRQGYVYESVIKMIQMAFGQIGIERIQAACMLSNEASMALLKKAGFQEEGIARNYLKIRGAWTDQMIFSLLKSDVYGAAKTLSSSETAL